MLFLELLGIIPVFLFLVLIISVFIGVPFLPTHRKQAKKMMALANLKPGMKVIDLGSGGGRLLFLAAAQGVNATGYELNPFLVMWTKLMIFLKGYSEKVDVKLKSLYAADLREADVVFAFLFPKPMEKLASKFQTELKPGALVVSYVFAMSNLQPIHKEEGVLVYKM